MLRELSVSSPRIVGLKLIGHAWNVHHLQLLSVSSPRIVGLKLVVILVCLQLALPFSILASDRWVEAARGHA